MVRTPLSAFGFVPESQMQDVTGHSWKRQSAVTAGGWSFRLMANLWEQTWSP